MRRNREPSNGRHILTIAGELYSQLISGDGYSENEDHSQTEKDLAYLRHVIDTWETYQHLHDGKFGEADYTMKKFIRQVVDLYTEKEI